MTLLWLALMASAVVGRNGVPGMSVFKSRAAAVSKRGKREAPQVTFADVAGVDEAKEELVEIVEILKAPERFTRLGARPPTGVLLVGPPGTGKTLLAKAVAGEAGVPFFSISGSEFVEVFVGVGASRVRDLFAKAKANAPCIIFVDEIDAVGRSRGTGVGGGNDEREQTLNQLLTEMDGFEGNSGVIVVAATNRADILDPALLRPGRFDRQVSVDVPDVKGRLDILKVHAANKRLSEEVSLDAIAKRTPGFSGADLANLMNEAAILTGRRGKAGITLAEIDDSVDRIVAGLEGTRMTDSKGKSLVAYHEVGHAICATLQAGHDPVQKVTLVPRGQARGLTWFVPGEDAGLISRSQLFARVVGALGGRAAEEVIFGEGEVTTGAGGDLRQVTSMARQMVVSFGMSDIGPWSLVAYHEVGHAICGTLTPGHDPVQKVTLVPRGQARGLTWFIPGEDPSLISKQQIFARIVGALGGRAAEETVFGAAEVTTGASSDLRQVANMAKQMVVSFGMSDIGPWSLLDPSAQGGDMVMRMMARNSMSEKLAHDIDVAVQRIADEAYEVALSQMRANRVAIDAIVEELNETETMTGERFREILSQYTTIPAENLALAKKAQTV